MRFWNILLVLCVIGWLLAGTVGVVFAMLCMSVVLNVLLGVMLWLCADAGNEMKKEIQRLNAGFPPQPNRSV